MYALNEKGGWIVPAHTKLEAGTEVPAFSEFGYGCALGSGCKFDWRCEFGSHCKFGDDCKFGYSNKFGDNCGFGVSCKFDNFCTFDNFCAFSSGCKFGRACRFGWSITLTGCTVLDLVVKRFMTLANVDGSGRQVLVVLGECGNIKVETGCFCGSVKEFCVRAKSEGKPKYIDMIKCAAKTLKKYEDK